MKKFFYKKKILITGNTGFKGSWLTMWLLRYQCKILGISKDIPTNPSLYKILNLDKKIKFKKMDIANKQKLFTAFVNFKPDYVFHLAAQSVVSKSIKDPIENWNTNLLGTLNVIECVKKFKHRCTLVLVTSDKCYKNLEKLNGYSETSELGGTDPYSASKAAIENLYYSHFNTYLKKLKNINSATGRAGNVIGGGDFTKDRIVPDTIKKWKNNKVAKIRNPNAIRPWQHVLEPISGYLWLACMLNKKQYNGENFNFGPKKNAIKNVSNLLEELRQTWKNKVWKKINNKIKQETNILVLNCSKSSKFLKWIPVMNFKEMCFSTASWYMNYYKNKKEIINYTNYQINNYIKKAKIKNLKWALYENK